MNKLVTCPETNESEMVEYADTPLGMLIHRCTRFRPACAMNCSRECAATSDREARLIQVTETGCELDDTVELATTVVRSRESR